MFERHSRPIAPLFVVTAALLEFTLGICVLKEVCHATLGQLYIALGLVTLLGLFGHFHH
jgi:hypothetical protein